MALAKLISSDNQTPPPRISVILWVRAASDLTALAKLIPANWALEASSHDKQSWHVTIKPQ
jgi:hypothetical protein